MRRLAALALTLALVANAALAALVLAQSPFARPLVLRSQAAATAALERALAAQATPEWLATRAEQALAEDDLDRLAIFRDLAADQGQPLPPDLTQRIEARLTRRSGLLASVQSCGACALDMNACESLAQMSACALTVELTPLGDLNALRRAGVAVATGEEVDRIDTGLALVGLAATGAALASGGSSYTVKAGASVLRLARRAGALTPKLILRLGDLAAHVVDWSRLDDVIRGRVGLPEITDLARLEELQRMAQAAAMIRAKTSLAETVVLLRHVDSLADAEDLARVAVIRGGRTRHTLEALGKPRALRILHRVADLALLAIGLLALLAAQLASLALGLALRLLRRWAWYTAPARRRRLPKGAPPYLRLRDTAIAASAGLGHTLTAGGR